MIGKSLSHFKITAKLGEGGMGEVYRATDTRLGREVAIKVLAEAFTEDSERFARFEREAKVLASLNHPNIAGIHQVEEVDGTYFLVMELVEGNDLAARLSKGPIPISEAIPLALQIAEGLEAAHGSTVIHRDLKPANIKVTPDGKVKILDFGLAKASQAADEGSRDLSQSPTLTAQMTQAGVILGTAGYMSPEQARGEQTDQRADIWSFGVVLYEMLTGSQLFAEPTASDTLAAVLRADIDWDRLPEGTPYQLRRLLRRCVERDPRQRLHAIADARIELEAPEEERGLAASSTQSTPIAWNQILVAALSGVIATLGISLLLRVPAGRSKETLPLRSLQVVAGVGVEPSSVNAGLNLSEPRVSPDGSMVAYPFDGLLWIRDMDQLAPRPLDGTDDVIDAFWSPDSQALAYVVGEELRRVDAQGGPSILLARLESFYIGGTWGDEDRIVVALGGRGLFELPARGGVPSAILTPDTEAGDFDFHSPTFLGDGGSLAFVRHPQNLVIDTIEVFDGNDRHVAYRSPAGSHLTGAAFDASARQLIVAVAQANAGLWALPLDIESGIAESEARLLIPHGLAPSIAADGSLVYVDGLRFEPNRLVRVDRSGSVIGEVGQALWDIRLPVSSPDASRVVTRARHDGSPDLWVHDLERGTALRATTDPQGEFGAAWADGGESLVYASGYGKISRLLKRRADGVGEATVLMEGQLGRPSLPSDGSFLTYQVGRGGQADIWWFPIGQPDAAEPLIATPADEVQPAVSPDGKLLAYTSDDSGRMEIYLQPLSGAGARIRVSAQGGELPIWSRTGRELYYIEESTLVAVGVGPDGKSLSAPDRLFSGSDVSSPLVEPGGNAMITLGPGSDFLVVQRRLPGNPAVVSMQNWTQLLENKG